jgi:hypothetical protein
MGSVQIFEVPTRSMNAGPVKVAERANSQQIESCHCSKTWPPATELLLIGGATIEPRVFA